MANSQTAINTSNQAVSTANNNKQEFDALRNDFDKLVGEAGTVIQKSFKLELIRKESLSLR